MHESERLYRRVCKDQKSARICREKQSEFKSARRAFDKLLKKQKIEHNRGLLLEIEDCNTKNPRMFWDYIRNLGPHKVVDIPWEVVTPEGDITSEKERVLEVWRDAYEKLYQAPEGDFDDIFQQWKIAEGSMMEKEMLSDGELNKPITLFEVKKAVKNSKSKKAVGIDYVSNELLKHPEVEKLLVELFNCCMEKRLIPDTL